MVRCVVTDREGLLVTGPICFVLSRAKRSDVISASATRELVSTNIKCNVGDSEGALRNRIQLEGLNVLLVSIGTNRPLRRQLRIE